MLSKEPLAVKEKQAEAKSPQWEGLRFADHGVGDQGWLAGTGHGRENSSDIW